MSQCANRTHYCYRVVRFTLLELLLAIVILLIVLTVVSLSFRTVTASWVNMETNTARIEQQLQISRFMNNELRNVIPFVYENFATKNQEVCFDGTEESLWGVTRSRVNSEETTGLRFFHIFVADNQLILEYKNSPFFIAETSQIVLDPVETSKVILAHDVEKIEFTYYFFSATTQVQLSNGACKMKRNFLLQYNLKLYTLIKNPKSGLDDLASLKSSGLFQR